MRVVAIYALVELKATEALPRLRQLLDDNARPKFGRLESVVEAAQAAIAKLEIGGRPLVRVQVDAFVPEKPQRRALLRGSPDLNS